MSGVAGALCCETAETMLKQETAKQANMDATIFIDTLLELHTNLFIPARLSARRLRVNF
jgi:hypothetical protein